MICHWYSVDTSSITEPQQLSSISLNLWYYWAMLVIISTWFGPQVSYQILKSLAFSLWSEFWRHRNDFTISDYYSSVKVMKHYIRTEKNKKAKKPQKTTEYSHTFILFRISHMKPFLFYWGCQQNWIIPALHPLGWVTKYTCISWVHFRAHKNIQATKARVISIDVYRVSLLSEMQTPRGDAAESLIVEQLFAGFNTSCGWHCLNYWLQMTHPSTFQSLIGHMSCQNISTPTLNGNSKANPI